MNNRRILIAAVFHFVRPVARKGQLKTSQDDTNLRQPQLSVNKFPGAV